VSDGAREVLRHPGAPTPETPVADARDTARHARTEGARVGAPVDLNVPPYYPSRRSRARFPDHPRCPLPTAVAALRALCELRAELAAPPGGVYLGWQDEGHDQEPDARRPEPRRRPGRPRPLQRHAGPGGAGGDRLRPAASAQRPAAATGTGAAAPRTAATSAAAPGAGPPAGGVTTPIARAPAASRRRIVAACRRR